MSSSASFPKGITSCTATSKLPLELCSLHSCSYLFFFLSYFICSRVPCELAKADRRPREKKKFYGQFSIVKYSYLPTDTFRKYVEMHVTRSKLTLKFTGYCRQTSYTDSTVIHTLVPAVAWELQSQFAPGYMHFNIFF